MRGLCKYLQGIEFGNCNVLQVNDLKAEFLFAI